MYTKIVWSGDEVETYNYKHEPRQNHKKKKQRVHRTASTDDRPRQRRGDNVQRARRSFKRIVQSTLFYHRQTFLVTLTTKEVLDVRQGYKYLHEYVQKLRRKIGKEFCYIAVPEFQKRGAIHFHMLLWNIPISLFYNERETRYLASIWGHGFLDIKLTDGSKRLIGYLTKYMTKAFVEPKFAEMKAYTASRNVHRPQTFKGSMLLDYSKEILGTDLSTAIPVYTKKFDVQWMGECNYNKYKLE